MTEAPNDASLRVLVVEHDPADAQRCVYELQKAGFQVHADVVATPGGFAARVGSQPYDVVLADYELPGWTGLEALRALKNTGAEIPFILVTGTLGDERAVECVKQGAADYIVKHNLDRLPTAVRRALQDKRDRDEHARNDIVIRKLQLAVDHWPASVMITDTSGKIEYVNQRFTQVTGYHASEVVGKNPRLLKSGRTPPNVYRDLWSTIQAGTVWHGEVLNCRKNGELLWDELTIAPIRDTDGAVTHFVATQEEVAQRRQAEFTLRDREAQFRQLAENIREVFFVMDVHFRETLYINPAYEEIWGRSCQSLYEKPSSFLEPIPLDDRKRLVESILHTQKGELTPDIEFRVIRPNGDLRWVLVQAVPIRNERGDVYRISGVALDITERKRVQEALAVSEARHRTLTEASFDGIAIVHGGTVCAANRGFAQIFGYEVSEVIGRDVADFVAQESLYEVRRRITARADGSYEFVGKRKDGREIILEATGKTHEIDGRPERVTALRDITEKRHLENHFRQSQTM